MNATKERLAKTDALYLPESWRAMDPETIVLVSDLIRGLRHELGNLTTVLSLDVSLLEQSFSRFDRMQLGELKSNLNDLTHLLGRLKDYPQPETHFAAVDLTHVLTEAVDQASRRTNGVPMLITLKTPPAVLIDGDKSGLFRVLLSILDNAVEANRRVRGERIQVVLTTTVTQAILYISDEGGGFAVEMLNAPFSPAYTTKITDGFMRGLGMGLFIAHAIMSLHGGTIALCNRSEGGAQVTITLPLLLS